MALRLESKRGFPQGASGVGGQQSLTSAGNRHHPRRDRLGNALDFQRFRAARNVLRAVGPQNDGADMQTGARSQGRIEVAERAVIRHRVRGRIRDGVEQQKHAVGLVDLPPSP